MLVLVDENDLFRSALATNLRDDGYDVLEFRTGTTVPVDRLVDVDALLSEYVLSGESGLNLARRFHIHHPLVPVVIMTRAAAALSTKVADLGYVTVLPKPLEYEALARVLQWVVQSQRSRGH